MVSRHKAPIIKDIELYHKSQKYAGDSPLTAIIDTASDVTSIPQAVIDFFKLQHSTDPNDVVKSPKLNAEGVMQLQVLQAFPIGLTLCGRICGVGTDDPILAILNTEDASVRIGRDILRCGALKIGWDDSIQSELVIPA